MIGQTAEHLTHVDSQRVIGVEALGTAESVVAWGQSKGFDESYQQQAFEVGSFTLPFDEYIRNNCLSDSRKPVEAVNKNGRSLCHNKVELQALWCHKKEQLVMLLDGPGGYKEKALS